SGTASVTRLRCRRGNGTGTGGVHGQRDPAVVGTTIVAGALDDLAVAVLAIADRAYLVCGQAAADQEVAHGVCALHAELPVVGARAGRIGEAFHRDQDVGVVFADRGGEVL